ncbi:MAG: PIN domain-containing protein [Anaerolineales bacterium]|nr:PIN domain-containing protein [Anaerolineales bacterium]
MNDKLPVYVLDSFALLAYLSGEEGAERVGEILSDASHDRCYIVMSLINLGEVLYITERERGLAKTQEALALIEQLPIDILPVNHSDVLSAAHIKAHFPVAYADAFAIVVAQSQDGVLVTGDPEFKVVGKDARIEWVGKLIGSE